MSESKTTAASADWTQLLTDPDLVSHLGKLLQTYRDAAPEKREQALLDAMLEIKGGAGKKPKEDQGRSHTPTTPTAELAASAVAPASDPPPFAPQHGLLRAATRRSRVYR